MDRGAERRDYEIRKEFLADFAYIIRALNGGYVLEGFDGFDCLLLLGKGGYSLILTAEQNFNIASHFEPYSEDETLEEVIDMVKGDEKIKILLPDLGYSKNIYFCQEPPVY